MSHVFMSYSHADEALRNELEKHLAGLLRQGVITRPGTIAGSLPVRICTARSTNSSTPRSAGGGP